MKKEQKVQQIEELSQGLKESEAVVFTDYSGLSVREISEFRKKLAEKGAAFKVVKNTLTKLAAEKVGLPFEELAGPTAVLLSCVADPIESIKALVSFLKEKGKGAVKFGIFTARGGPASGKEARLLSAAEVSELATIPSRVVLERRLVGALSAPLSRLVSVLQGNQRSLVLVLSELAKSRGGER